MQRRTFFRSFLGLAPAAAIAAPAKPERVMARADIPRCRCGYQLLIKGAWVEDGYPAPVPRGASRVEFMTCTNRLCDLYGKPFALPQVAIEAADPLAVRYVEQAERRAIAEKEAAERKWRERACKKCRREHHTAMSCTCPSPSID
jgi:hypothetical protein